MGRDFEYDRFGDIWCGIISKKICDHLGLAVTSGEPLVHHDRASNVFTNLIKEAPGYRLNETLWKLIDSVVLTGTTVASCAQQIADALSDHGEYAGKLGKAYRAWLCLFQVHGVPRFPYQTLDDALKTIRQLAASIGEA